MEKKLPVSCPSCRALLRAKRFECPSCKTVVEGDFPLPVLGRLSDDEQVFVQHLIKYSGSLKDLARSYGVSYPTVRNRLDALIEHIQALEAEKPEGAEEAGSV
jgi:hypothetical protein